eukprot:scaffold15323_cov15-Prasinocladus_malaysianus.AAC.1
MLSLRKKFSKVGKIRAFSSLAETFHTTDGLSHDRPGIRRRTTRRPSIVGDDSAASKGHGLHDLPAVGEASHVRLGHPAHLPGHAGRCGIYPAAPCPIFGTLPSRIPTCPVCSELNFSAGMHSSKTRTMGGSEPQIPLPSISVIGETRRFNFRQNGSSLSGLFCHLMKSSHCMYHSKELQYESHNGCRPIFDVSGLGIYHQLWKALTDQNNAVICSSPYLLRSNNPII